MLHYNHLSHRIRIPATSFKQMLEFEMLANRLTIAKQSVEFGPSEAEARPQSDVHMPSVDANER